MRLETKVQIAKTSLSSLAVVAGFFFLGVLVLVLCLGLQINPFKETTTSFLISAFVGLVGVAAVLVLLNVAANFSVLADVKLRELKVEPSQGTLKKWVLAFLATAVVLVALIFVGTYFSKKKYLGVVRRQANEVLSTNKNLLEEISRLLASGQYDDFKRINEIRGFLGNQRSGLPQLTLIYSGNFDDKLTLYKTPDYFSPDPQYKIYTPSYFPCTPNLDCDYLRTFFSGSNVSVLEKYTVRDDQFYIYIPFIGEKARFVLLFSLTNSYGKLGS